MKIKAVCEQTGLTDRAVRFYVEKGLVVPKSDELNGRIYYEYSEEDVCLLQNIVTLRRNGFSIEEILQMQKCPTEIDSVLRKRSDKMAEEARGITRLAMRLEETERKRPDGFADMDELAEELRQVERLQGESVSSQKAVVRKLPELKLEFGKYDPETEEEKERMYQEFLARQYMRNKAREPWERLGTGLKKLVPGFIRTPINRWMSKMAWSGTQLLLAFWGVVVALVLIGGMVLMIPRRLASFFPWEEMDESKIYVCHGRWEWSVSTNSNYKTREAEYAVGTREYEGLVELLETTCCSGFVQSLFPKNGHTIQGSNESILLDVLWEQDGKWQWKTMNLYDNGVLLVGTGRGSCIYYTDWFGSDDCERIFREVDELLRQSAVKKE